MKFSRSLAARLLLLLFPMAGLAALATALPRAAPTDPILILRLPGAPGIAETVAKAGGYPVGLLQPPFGRIVHSQDPDFLSRLRVSGAFLLLNADQLPDFLCGRYA